MGFDTFSLFARIGLDTREYDEALDGASKKTSNFASKLGGGLKTAAKVGAAAVGVATTAATAFAKGAVDVGAQFDASMSQVAATMGTTVDEIGELRDFAQEMGASTAFSATQAADALNYMALAGYTADEAMEALPNVLNLAAAGGIDLAQASDMVTDAQSALGLSMEESAELVDKMAKASSKSNTSVAQLGEAILTIGGTAKNLAGGTTELSTELGILADNGVKGAEGGTALRNIILSLSAPTNTAAAAMEGLGLNVYDAAGNMRPLNDVFGDLGATLSTMTQGEQMEVLNTIFNKVDLKSVNALLANTGKRFDELSGYIDDATGAAEAMANTQLDNLAGDTTLLKSAFEGLQIALSDKLTPAIRDGVDFLTKLTEAATQFVESGGLEKAADLFGKLAPLIAATTAALIAYQGASKVAAFIELLTKVTEGQSIAQAALNAVMSANPFVLVATAVAALVAGITTLWLTNEDFRNAVSEIWDGITSAVSGAVEKIKSIIGGIKDAFSGVVDGVKNLLGIHSPSRVFAGIGENMALGLGNGWDNEFFHIKSDIEGGMDFGTATMDFESSGLGQSSRTISGGIMAASAGAAFGSGQNTPIDVTLTLDGAVLARKLFGYSQSEGVRRGDRLVPVEG